MSAQALTREGVVAVVVGYSIVVVVVDELVMEGTEPRSLRVQQPYSTATRALSLLHLPQSLQSPEWIVSIEQFKRFQVQ